MFIITIQNSSLVKQVMYIYRQICIHQLSRQKYLDVPWTCFLFHTKWFISANCRTNRGIPLFMAAKAREVNIKPNLMSQGNYSGIWGKQNQTTKENHCLGIVTFAQPYKVTSTKTAHIQPSSSVAKHHDSWLTQREEDCLLSCSFDHVS